MLFDTVVLGVSVLVREPLPQAELDTVCECVVVTVGVFDTVALCVVDVESLCVRLGDDVTHEEEERDGEILLVRVVVAQSVGESVLEVVALWLADDDMVTDVDCDIDVVTDVESLTVTVAETEAD